MSRTSQRRFATLLGVASREAPLRDWKMLDASGRSAPLRSAFDAAVGMGWRRGMVLGLGQIAGLDVLDYLIKIFESCYLCNMRCSKLLEDPAVKWDS